MNLAFVISGHERSGLSDPSMYQFIVALSEYFAIDLYLHTWHVNDVAKTWRSSLENQIRPIERSELEDYFTFLKPNIQIKYIDIEDDQHIQLEQTTTGNVSKLLPKVCWKNMWYAKFKCIEQLRQYPYDAVIMTRYDIFTYGIYTEPIRTKIPQLVDLVVRCTDYTQLYFLDQCNPTLRFLDPFQIRTQADNFVFGSPTKMTEFVHVFHYHLDDVLRDAHKYHYNHYNQEYLALGEGHAINHGRGSLREYQTILIVGCGLTGATIARCLADLGYTRITILDKRPHIGGNCYDYIDEDTGLLVSQYGAHIFHTSDSDVIRFVQRFSSWVPYKHSVKAKVDDQTYVPVPVNIDTVNAICHTHIQTEQEMKEWLSKECPQYETIRNGEEMALSRVGPVLYETLFKWYTKKQWDKFPSELDPSVLARIPVRTTFEDGYFNDVFQALPTHGYTHLIKNMISHPSIQVQLNTDFFDYSTPQQSSVVFYTGPIDRYFEHTGLPKLEYRSIDFTLERVYGEYQPYPVVNYPLMNTPYTRSIEYKHFPNQTSKCPKSIVVHEQTTSDGDPYYPVPNERNQRIYDMYKQLANAEPRVRFVGRLASYKYLNMDQAIRYALDEVCAFTQFDK